MNRPREMYACLIHNVCIYFIDIIPSRFVKRTEKDRKATQKMNSNNKPCLNAESHSLVFLKTRFFKTITSCITNVLSDRNAKHSRKKDEKKEKNTSTRYLEYWLCVTYFLKSDAWVYDCPILQRKTAFAFRTHKYIHVFPTNTNF